jgi:hypothetical protein
LDLEGMDICSFIASLQKIWHEKYSTEFLLNFWNFYLNLISWILIAQELYFTFTSRGQLCVADQHAIYRFDWLWHCKFIVDISSLCTIQVLTINNLTMDFPSGLILHIKLNSHDVTKQNTQLLLVMMLSFTDLTIPSQP